MLGKKLTTKDFTDIAHLHMSGMSYQEIANETGFSKKTIYTALKKNPECQEILKKMQEKYADELTDVAVDTLMDALLNSEQIPKGILIQYIQTALKYSNLKSSTDVNLNTNQTVKLSEISLEDLKKINYK